MDHTKLTGSSFSQCTSNFYDSNSLRDKVRNFLLTGESVDLQQHLAFVLLNQMSSKAGIEKHGNKAKEVLHEEFMQLHDMDIFLPIKKDRLTKE